MKGQLAREGKRSNSAELRALDNELDHLFDNTVEETVAERMLAEASRLQGKPGKEPDRASDNNKTIDLSIPVGQVKEYGAPRTETYQRPEQVALSSYSGAPTPLATLLSSHAHPSAVEVSNSYVSRPQGDASRNPAHYADLLLPVAHQKVSGYENHLERTSAVGAYASPRPPAAEFQLPAVKPQEFQLPPAPGRYKPDYSNEPMAGASGAAPYAPAGDLQLPSARPALRVSDGYKDLQLPVASQSDFALPAAKPALDDSHRHGDMPLPPARPALRPPAGADEFQLPPALSATNHVRPAAAMPAESSPAPSKTETPKGQRAAGNEHLDGIPPAKPGESSPVLRPIDGGSPVSGATPSDTAPTPKNQEAPTAGKPKADSAPGAPATGDHVSTPGGQDASPTVKPADARKADNGSSSASASGDQSPIPRSQDASVVSKPGDARKADRGSSSAPASGDQSPIPRSQDAPTSGSTRPPLPAGVSGSADNTLPAKAPDAPVSGLKPADSKKPDGAGSQSGDHTDGLVGLPIAKPGDAPQNSRRPADTGAPPIPPGDSSPVTARVNKPTASEEPPKSGPHQSGEVKPDAVPPVARPGQGHGGETPDTRNGRPGPLDPANGGAGESCPVTNRHKGNEPAETRPLNRPQSPGVVGTKPSDKNEVPAVGPGHRGSGEAPVGDTRNLPRPGLGQGTPPDPSNGGPGEVCSRKNESGDPHVGVIPPLMQVLPGITGMVQPKPVDRDAPHQPGKGPTGAPGGDNSGNKGDKKPDASIPGLAGEGCRPFDPTNPRLIPGGGGGQQEIPSLKPGTSSPIDAPALPKSERKSDSLFNEIIERCSSNGKPQPMRNEGHQSGSPPTGIPGTRPEGWSPAPTPSPTGYVPPLDTVCITRPDGTKILRPSSNGEGGQIPRVSALGELLIASNTPKPAESGTPQGLPVPFGGLPAAKPGLQGTGGPGEICKSDQLSPLNQSAQHKPTSGDTCPAVGPLAEILRRQQPSPLDNIVQGPGPAPVSGRQGEQRNPLEQQQTKLSDALQNLLNRAQDVRPEFKQEQSKPVELVRIPEPKPLDVQLLRDEIRRILENIGPIGKPEKYPQGDKPQGPVDKPSDKPQQSDRPLWQFEKPSEKPQSDRLPQFDRPQAEKPQLDKPQPDKPQADKPQADKPQAEKPQAEKPQPQLDKPQVDRPQNERMVNSESPNVNERHEVVHYSPVHIPAEVTREQPVAQVPARENVRPQVAPSDKAPLTPEQTVMPGLNSTMRPPLDVARATTVGEPGRLIDYQTGILDSKPSDVRRSSADAKGTLPSLPAGDKPASLPAPLDGKGLPTGDGKLQFDARIPSGKILGPDGRPLVEDLRGADPIARHHSSRTPDGRAEIGRTPDGRVIDGKVHPTDGKVLPDGKVVLPDGRIISSGDGKVHPGLNDSKDQRASESASGDKGGRSVRIDPVLGPVKVIVSPTGETILVPVEQNVLPEKPGDRKDLIDKGDKKKEDEDKDKDKELLTLINKVKDKKPDAKDQTKQDDNTKKQQLLQHRRKYVVRTGDTVESVASAQLGDERFSVLICIINRAVIKFEWEGAKSVAKLRAGQIIWLPSQMEMQVHRAMFFKPNRQNQQSSQQNSAAPSGSDNEVSIELEEVKLPELQLGVETEPVQPPPNVPAIDARPVSPIPTEDIGWRSLPPVAGRPARRWNDGDDTVPVLPSVTPPVAPSVNPPQDSTVVIPRAEQSLVTNDAATPSVEPPAVRVNATYSANAVDYRFGEDETDLIAPAPASQPQPNNQNISSVLDQISGVVADAKSALPASSAEEQRLRGLLDKIARVVAQAQQSHPLPVSTPDNSDDTRTFNVPDFLPQRGSDQVTTVLMYVQRTERSCRVITVENPDQGFSTRLQISKDQSEWTTIASYECGAKRAVRYLNKGDGSIDTFDLRLPPGVIRSMASADFLRNWESYVNTYAR